MTKVGFLAVALVAAASGQVEHERRPSQFDLLRRFGYGVCLEQGYHGTPFGVDAERSADLSRQMGTGPLKVYDEIRSASAAVEPAKPTLDGHNFAIWKCLEFYDGSTLRELARRGTSSARSSPKK